MTIASTPTTTKRTVIATALAGVAALSVGAARLFADREGPGSSDAAAAVRPPRATPLPIQAEVELLIRPTAPSWLRGLALGGPRELQAAG